MNNNTVCTFLLDFKYELALCLSGTLPVPDFYHIEKQLFSSNNSVKGNVRNCFNYLLIDPRITKQLPAKIGELQRFRVFVEAIFYIGKGQKDRPLQHLLDAKESQLAAPNKVSIEIITWYVCKMHRVSELKAA